MLALQVAQAILAAAPSGAAVVGSAPRTFLSASSSATEVSLSAGLTAPRTGDWVQGITFEGTAPLSKGQKEEDFATRDRLSDGAEFGLVFHTLHWKAPVAPLELIRWCQARKHEAVDALPEVSDCNEITAAELTPLHNAQYKAAARFRQAWYFDVSGKIGRATRQYLATSTLLPDSLDATAWSVGLTVARFFSTARLHAGAWSIGPTYGVSYKEQREGQGCTPVGSTGALQCRSAPIGAPKRKEGAGAKAEVRAFLNAKFGIDPYVTYKAKGQVFSAGLPLFFVSSEKGDLIGGAEPTFDTDTHRWDIRLFVGTAAFGLVNTQ